MIFQKTLTLRLRTLRLPFVSIQSTIIQTNLEITNLEVTNLALNRPPKFIEKEKEEASEAMLRTFIQFIID